MAYSIEGDAGAANVEWQPSLIREPVTYDGYSDSPLRYDDVL